MQNSLRRSLPAQVVFVLLAAFCSSAFAQNWVEKMQDPNVNFYEVQRSFNEYWEGKDLANAKGWKQFKRWEYFMAPRVYPSGNRPAPNQTAKAFASYINTKSFASHLANANWTSLGPSSWQTVSYNPGIGRVNCIAVDPTNSDVIYVGVPSGGFWKTTDGATTWSTTTDELPVLGVTSIAIDPTNPNVVYMASGDGDAGDTYSIGVLKSEDAGATWSATGLNFEVTQARTISKLLIHPTDSNILLAAANNGVYKTTDAGNTWSLVLAGNFKDMEFKPGDANTVYVCGTAFFVSTNAGSSFAGVSAGLPAANQVSRLALAVTEANPEYVYVLAGNATDSGLLGVYRSTNGGASFSLRASAPNLLGYSPTGATTGGQAWYDLSLAASPSNAEEVYVGGINIWKSLNGGASWSLNAYWFYPPTTVPYVHADIHALDFFGATLFAGADGGIFSTNSGGRFWGDLSSGLVSTQFYRITGHPANADVVFGGAQDNGTNRMQAGAWTHVLGADGMECIADYSDANIVYAAIQSGGLRKSSNGGNSFVRIDSSFTEDGAWVTPYVIHPSNPQILFAGFRNVWKTTNRGKQWFPISALPNSSSLQSLVVAASNPNYIYAATDRVIYKTANGGASWVNISSGLPTTRAAMTYIAAADDDPNKVWVTFSGYAAATKVFSSRDGGATWRNDSGTLPNLPVNCIVREDGGNDALYIGTDVGVYYRDAAMSDWAPFNSGLPNVIVNELEIHAGTQKLRAATYGRGLWESPLQSGVAATPKLFLKPQALRFDTLGLGSLSGALRAAITNVGAEPLTLTSMTLGSASFQLRNAPSLPLTLPPASELALLVEFAPLVAGASVDSIRIQSNDPTQRVAKIALSGYALGRAAFSGIVKDSVSHAPIAARLEFLRAGETAPQVVSTNLNGSYSVALFEGAYRVTVVPEIPYAEVQLENFIHGAQGTAKDFLLKPTPLVLVEDDSTGAAAAVYRAMLEELGYKYSVWNTSAQGATVPAERLPFLAQPAIVLWATGETSADVLTAEDRTVIRGHLDHGGKLLLSGDNIAETTPRNDTLFANYFGVEFNSNYAQPIIRGFAGDPIGNGIVTGANGASKDQLQLAASPQSLVQKVFRYGTSASDTARIAAIRAEDAAQGWRAVYFGFRLELASQINRKTIFARALEWLSEEAVAVEDREEANVPSAFRLEQNYPNPFNPQTTIAYALPQAALVTLTVYNSLGQEVAVLVNGKKAPGRYAVMFDASFLPNGVYVYKLEAEGVTLARKLVLLK